MRSSYRRFKRRGDTEKSSISRGQEGEVSLVEGREGVEVGREREGQRKNRWGGRGGGSGSWASRSPQLAS